MFESTDQEWSSKRNWETGIENRDRSRGGNAERENDNVNIGVRYGTSPWLYTYQANWDIHSIYSNLNMHIEYINRHSRRILDYSKDKLHTHLQNVGVA